MKNINCNMKRQDPVIDSKVSIGARKYAKAVANEIWDSYDDTYGYKTEKQLRNAKIDVYDPDCLIFFIGQFDSSNQIKFIEKIRQSLNKKYKKELLDWVEAYYDWYRLGNRQENTLDK